MSVNEFCSKMDESEFGKLLKCIGPTSIKEPTLEDMWIEPPDPRKHNDKTEGSILHVKKEIILNLEEIKECVKSNNLKMIQLKDEWIIYEPRK